MLGGLVPGGALMGTLSTAAGFAGSNIILDRLPLGANWKTGNMRIVAKAGVALLAGFLLRKFTRNTTLANGIVVGGLTAAALDVLNKVMPAGLKGLGQFEIDDIPNFSFAGGELPQLGMLDEDDLEGLGNTDDVEYIVVQ